MSSIKRIADQNLGDARQQQVVEPCRMNSFFESDMQRPLQAPDEVNDSGCFCRHRRLQVQFSASFTTAVMIVAE